MATVVISYSYHHGLFDKYAIPQVPHKTPSYLIPVVLVMTFAYLSSTWPDLDHPQSRHGKKHPKISQYLNIHYGHRGLTHYPVSLMVGGSLLYLLITSIKMPENIYMGCLWGLCGVIVGYASHILLDTLNSAGVSLLMPFSRVRFKIPTGVCLRKQQHQYRLKWRYLKGGSLFDELILLCLCVGGIYVSLRVF